MYVVQFAVAAVGALAMLASVPISWFFGLTLPFAATRLLVNLVVFAGVGVCMADVFLRVMKALEPDRSRACAAVWLGLVVGFAAEVLDPNAVPALLGRGHPM